MAANFRSKRRAEIAEEHVTIEVIAEENLVLSIKEKMEEVSILGTICRVPDELLKGNEKQYLPRLVSIGPLQHGKITHAKEDKIKNLKWQYLNSLLVRKPGLEQTLDFCIKCLKDLEEKSRKCYKENLDHIGSNEFVQMMLLDGCFIIELFLKFAIKNLRRRDDPFFTKSDQFFTLRCDLILLENQIPFFILQHLFHLVPVPEQCKQSIIQLALWFFRKWIPGDGQRHIHEKFGPDVLHLLDLVRQCHLPGIPEMQSHGKEIKLPNVTELKAQGISFNFANTETLLNIKFDDGILEIPTLVIHEHTEILFRNLVALESCSSTYPKHVTSYILLMKQLIETKNDIRMLENRQILINCLEKKGEIINLFQRFHDLNIKAEDFYYRWLCEKMEEYGKIKLQNQWCRRIKHFYAKTPFGIAGFSFAVLVMVSIFTAALFTALELFLHHVN